MRHHTKDVEKRAWDIAQREAEKVWEKTHDLIEYLETGIRVYQKVLREFQPDPELALQG